MKLIPITEAQANRLKAHGVEPEITYAIPESLYNLVSGLGKTNKRRAAKTTSATLTLTTRSSSRAKIKNEFTFYPKKNKSASKSNAGATVVKMQAGGLKTGDRVTRSLIYKLIPDKTKKSWIVYDLCRSGVLVP